MHALTDGEGQPLEILHRDVTPSNILLTANGGIKLLDFGVAKYRGSASLTRAGTMRGKPAYLAPEQIEGAAGGAPIDRRVDIFALGVVLHEMLSLEHLFAGDSDLITVKKVLEMKIPLPSARRPDVPPALDAIVMKALERDRDRRYASAGAMARDLDDLVVSARVHVDEVVAFVASIERECRAWTRSSPSPVVRRRWNDAIADATTVKDPAQQQRLSGLRRARRVANHRAHGRARRRGAGRRGARDRGRPARQRDHQERRGSGGAARCRDPGGAAALRAGVVGRRHRRPADRKMTAVRVADACAAAERRVRSRAQFAYASAEQEPLDRISLYSFLKRFSSGRSTVRSRLPGS